MGQEELKELEHRKKLYEEELSEETEEDYGRILDRIKNIKKEEEQSREIYGDNLVFKCNWNDAGWKKICSKKARDYNISKDRTWCCDKRNECARLIKENKKEFPCYESLLFKEFSMGPGTNLGGKKDMEPRFIRGSRPGKLAFLTTVAPEMDGKDRYFIGLLDIKEIKNEQEVIGNKETSIVINPSIKLKFWDYYKNKDESKQWGSSLFRYLSDEVALIILEDLKKEYDKLKGFEKEKENLNGLIERYKKYLE